MVKKAPIIGFANALVGRSFEWGKFDCNTNILKFLDFYANTYPAIPEYYSITKDVVGQYENKRGARSFYKNFNLTWDAYLSAFCEVNPAKPKFQAGDIIMAPLSDGTFSSHICLGGKSFSTDPILGSVLVSTIKLLSLKDVIIYRPRR